MAEGPRTFEALLGNPFARATTGQLWHRLTRQRQGTTDLHEAARGGDSDGVVEALKMTNALDLDKTDEEGRTALHLALRAGSLDIVRLLLKAGASPDPPSLPPPSIADLLYLLFRTLKSAIQWFAIIWITSKLGLPTLSIVRHHAKSLAAAQLVAMALSYVLSSVILVGRFPDFRQDSVAMAVTAFKGNTEETVLVLLESGFRPQLWEMMILWVDAVYKGQARVCQRLLDMGWHADISFEHVGPYEDPVELTALLYASGALHKDLVSMLLCHGADPTQIDSRGWSCLLLASMQWYRGKGSTAEDSDDTLRALLASDAVKHLNRNHFPENPNRGQSVFELKWGWPLAEACRNLCPSAVELLLDAGADPNLADEMGVTALHEAAGVCFKDKELTSLRLLLAYGADVNSTTTDSWTPVGRVCNAGTSPEALEILLEAGASIEYGAGKDTPLQIAARHDVSEHKIVSMLLERGADVNVVGGRFGSALLAALNKPKSESSQPTVLKSVSDLIRHGADVNLVPEGRRAPIVEAAVHDWPLVVQLLLDHGAVLPPAREESLSKDGSKWQRLQLRITALSYLSPSQNEVIGLLLRHGADPNGDMTISPFGGDIGTTILGYACGSSNSTTARLLLEHGADPNSVDPRGCSPLHRAAYAVNLTHVRLLLEKGAGLDVTHEEYGTPWHSLCKGIAKKPQWDQDAESFKEICQLFGNDSDTTSIWAQDGSEKNCLHYLAELSEESYVVVDLDRGAWFGRSKAIDIMQCFLDRYCRLHPSVFLSEDNLGRTAFHIAAKRGDVDVMAMIIQQIASMDNAEGISDDSADIIAAVLLSTDKKGRTPLLLAASEGRVLACKFLAGICSGMPAETVVEMVETAATSAKQGGHFEVAELLATYSPDAVTSSVADASRDHILQMAAKDSVPRGFSADMLMKAIGEAHDRRGSS